MRCDGRTALLALVFTLLLSNPSMRAQQVPGATAAAASTQPHTAALGASRRRKRPAKPSAPPTSEQRQSLVNLKDGQLVIEANSAPLAQILDKLVAAGSMTVEGTKPVDLVFGTYGPGVPREVLTQLLTGSGYNFIMIGVAADGLPRQVLLNGKSGRSIAPAPGQPTAFPVRTPAARESVPVLPPSSAVDPAAAAEGGPEDANTSAASGTPLGPGALEHVPPNEQTDTQDTGTRVQQNMQRLQQMQTPQAPPSTAPQR